VLELLSLPDLLIQPVIGHLQPLVGLFLFEFELVQLLIELLLLDLRALVVVLNLLLGLLDHGELGLELSELLLVLLALEVILHLVDLGVLALRALLDLILLHPLVQLVYRHTQLLILPVLLD
jgi:hypothetical protein